MFQQLLEQIGLGLDTLGIPYMVIGGQAVLLYGEPRLTRDIDVTVGVGPDRVADLLRLAKERNWRVLSENPPDFVEKTMVLPCLEPTSGVRVDFIFSISAYERQALGRARRESIGKAQVCFASVEDIMIHKIVAGRPRDLEDARIIVAKQQTIDIDYVRHWLREFERGLSENFCGRFEAVWNAARGSK
ncbi:MAG: hypothetical protein A3J28_11700 [Acidobacteria bacterium RIFCSPLOWO2_12_FULL_60_22]|nr:MAG: hypothetical protein A3J28_11700 [Acidobacteria bacterium RIFCSPLOWO2_12_FULL_60_22]